jgi:hypothetical protein
MTLQTAAFSTVTATGVYSRAAILLVTATHGLTFRTIKEWKGRGTERRVVKDTTF